MKIYRRKRKRMKRLEKKTKRRRRRRIRKMNPTPKKISEKANQILKLIRKSSRTIVSN